MGPNEKKDGIVMFDIEDPDVACERLTGIAPTSDTTSFK